MKSASEAAGKALTDDGGAFRPDEFNLRLVIVRMAPPIRKDTLTALYDKKLFGGSDKTKCLESFGFRPHWVDA